MNGTRNIIGLNGTWTLVNFSHTIISFFLESLAFVWSESSLNTSFFKRRKKYGLMRSLSSYKKKHRKYTSSWLSNTSGIHKDKNNYNSNKAVFSKRIITFATSEPIRFSLSVAFFSFPRRMAFSNVSLNLKIPFYSYHMKHWFIV